MSDLGLFYDMDDGEYVPLLELNADDPESAARTLRKHMSPDTRRTLARLLLEVEELLRQLIAVLDGLMADAHATGKTDRLTEYAELRAKGVGRGEAAWWVGVSDETARRYEHEIAQGAQ